MFVPEIRYFARFTFEFLIGPGTDDLPGEEMSDKWPTGQKVTLEKRFEGWQAPPPAGTAAKLRPFTSGKGEVRLIVADKPTFHDNDDYSIVWEIVLMDKNTASGKDLPDIPWQLVVAALACGWHIATSSPGPLRPIVGS
ncbi:MAG: hypothetical protein QOG91_640 [Candidatus Parcubacteria bacterium]|jgi:hypothetical protein|nr:hypothetical protein [Candidatus Parcubacteria bacterium]